VAARTCPYCLKKISSLTIVTHSYDLTCPGCDRPLEISRISRNIASLLGLIAGTIAFYWSAGTSPEHQALGWVFPVLYAIIAFGVVSMLVLLTTADLSIKSEPHHAEPHAHATAPAGGHGTGHH